MFSNIVSASVRFMCDGHADPSTRDDTSVLVMSAAPSAINRKDLQRIATISGSPAPDESVSEASAAIQAPDAEPYAQLAAIYGRADVMINPSLADNMPISILEALASGVPVVSTDVGGIPYLVEHGKTALLVSPQDPEAMANAVLLLLNDPAKAMQLRQAGAESVQCYTWPNVRDRLLCVYDQVLTKSDGFAVSNK